MVAGAVGIEIAVEIENSPAEFLDSVALKVQNMPAYSHRHDRLDVFVCLVLVEGVRVMWTAKIYLRLWRLYENRLPKPQLEHCYCEYRARVLKERALDENPLARREAPESFVGLLHPYPPLHEFHL